MALTMISLIDYYPLFKMVSDHATTYTEYTRLHLTQCCPNREL